MTLSELLEELKQVDPETWGIVGLLIWLCGG